MYDIAHIKKPRLLDGAFFLAGATGLEPDLPELHSGCSNEVLDVITVFLVL